jgi:putative GTP pyrophosphokinase
MAADEQDGSEVAAVSARTKRLESFLEKTLRKSYADPFAETTDFAGVRVTCFYRDDLRKIENLIYDEFPDANKVEDVLVNNIDRFGYSASHYLVQLDDATCGRGGNDVKGKTCEIQIRTLLQDAWAMFSHHLLYKCEHIIPDSLQRQFYALAGALETADVAFQTIRDKRDGYVRSSRASVDRTKLGEVKTDPASLKDYFEQKYPHRPVDSHDDFLGFWHSRMPLERYPTLRQVDELMDRTETARGWVDRGLRRARIIGVRYSVFQLAWALALVHREIRDSKEFSDQVGTLVRPAMLLVGKPPVS